MTIKNRLLASTVIMFIVLVALGFGLGQAANFILFDVRETKVGFYFNDPSFFDSMMEKVSKMATSWSKDGDSVRWRSEVDKFNENYGGSNLALLLYVDDVKMAGHEINPEPLLMDLALSRTPGEHLVTAGMTSIYVNSHGRRKILLIDTDYAPGQIVYEDSNTIFRYLLIGGTAIFVMTSLISSLFLLKFVFKPVISALNTLRDGVHQIRDGNLDCRIDYEKKDEFADLCDDFNEMAGRLKAAEIKEQEAQESRQELVAGISHDLRSPLTTIKACAEGLEKGVAASPEKREKYLKSINTKVQNMEKIIDRLLVFSKLNIKTFPVNLESLDLNELVMQSVKDAWEAFDSKGLVLQYKLCPVKAPVNLDKVLFLNAVHNIFENSLKYKQAARGQLKINLDVGEDQVKVIFSDDGPGVPEESLSKIFDVFYRCDPARSVNINGSGLGLAITSRIISQLGGAIKAENRPGGGLTITMIFPVVEREE